jgi:Holliday junction resolvasome RuvABC endonuclease subunit
MRVASPVRVSQSLSRALVQPQKQTLLKVRRYLQEAPGAMSADALLTLGVDPGARNVGTACDDDDVLSPSLLDLGPLHSTSTQDCIAQLVTTIDHKLTAAADIKRLSCEKQIEAHATGKSQLVCSRLLAVQGALQALCYFKNIEFDLIEINDWKRLYQIKRTGSHDSNKRQAQALCATLFGEKWATRSDHICEAKLISKYRYFLCHKSELDSLLRKHHERTKGTAEEAGSAVKAQKRGRARATKEADRVEGQRASAGKRRRRSAGKATEQEEQTDRGTGGPEHVPSDEPARSTHVQQDPWC